MHDGSVLDLGDLPAVAPAKRRAMRGRFAKAAALAVVLPGAGVAALIAMKVSAPAGEPAVRLSLDDISRVEQLTVDDKAQIVVEGADAQQRNAALPASDRPLEPVGGFSIAATDRADSATALKCLSQAVYYEAAYEPIDGRRAVAQVVLNRVRHPAYPNSVCGVVYQGSERRTGCQFSFTCDGSLLRAPAPDAWRKAQAVARAALAGNVESSVGTATHYHADYVLPKWAFQLGKIAQLGRHIFYRFNGSWGRSAAFHGRYSGIERIPAINFAALRERASNGDGTALADAYAPGLTVAPHVTDRHATSDVGGRLDVTKPWRLSIPDPTHASSRYRETVEQTSDVAPADRIALTEHAKPESVQ